MTKRRIKLRGFTLIELILVMIILTIVAGAVAPILRGFTAGRRTANVAREMLALAQYARTQSESEGRVYRLNFDTMAGAFWLTADKDGAFAPPPNDFGDRQTLPSGITMQVEITAPVVPLDEQETGMPGAAPAAPVDQYVEFDPSGRSQTVTVTLKGESSVVELACASATDELRILPQQEMGR